MEQATIAGAQQFLQNNQNVIGQQAIQNSTLRHEEWKLYDTKLIEVARKRLNLVNDLRGAGLMKSLGGIGTTLSLYERSGDMTDAHIDMDGATIGQKDRVTFDEVGVPVPVIHKEFSLNARQLEASRKLGQPLSTTQMGIATRIVMDTVENMLTNGSNIVVDGKRIYGYTNHPDRNTYTIPTSWTDDSADIIGDVATMIQTLINDDQYGRFTLYYSTNYAVKLQLDYNDQKGDKTYMERIMAFAEISSVKVADYLPDNTVILVRLEEDTVDMVIGQDFTNAEFRQMPMTTDFMVYGIMAPRIKSDMNGKCGLLHATTS